jgi:PTS system nitrogen regulatory IIA component
VAIPHPRSPLEDAYEKAAITTFFLTEPVDYGAVDDRPVFVMFLILSPDVKTHLHLLSRLAFCLRNDAFVTFLKSKPDPGKLLEKVEEFENHLEN